MSDNKVSHKDLTPGFYNITSIREPDPVLVHVYNCTDLGGELVVGFNTHDGGGLTAVSELLPGVELVHVSIVENIKN